MGSFRNSSWSVCCLGWCNGTIAAPESDSVFVIFIGLAVFAVGIYLYRAAMPEYIIVLATSGSEVKALSSTDKEDIDSVIKALNDAFVHRG